jgi:hypothetical protein
LNCLALLVPINISFYCYYEIYKFIRERGSSMPDLPSANNGESLTTEQRNAISTHDMLQRQYAMAKKLLVLPVVFLLCWGFYAVLQV